MLPFYTLAPITLTTSPITVITIPLHIIITNKPTHTTTPHVSNMMKRSLRLLIILSPMLILATLFEPVWALVYVMFLGLSGLGKVLYSALNFNDCEKDSDYLRDEIIEAKKDLARKGFKFVS